MSVDFSLGEESDVFIPEKVSSPALTTDCPFSVTMSLFLSRSVPCARCFWASRPTSSTHSRGCPPILRRACCIQLLEYLMASEVNARCLFLADTCLSTRDANCFGWADGLICPARNCTFSLISSTPPNYELLQFAFRLAAMQHSCCLT